MTERQPIILHLQTKDKPLGVLISGKRFSGKDTFAALLHTELQKADIPSTVKSTAVHLKKRFCRKYNLNATKFLTDRDYKEQHREKLATWVSSQSKDKNFRSFLNSIQRDLMLMQVIIISDLRNSYDYEQFSFIFPAFLSIRIEASPETRTSRGFMTTSYDESIFETEVEHLPYDYAFENNDSVEALTKDAANLGNAISVHITDRG